MDVSIILVNYNTKFLTLECLSSLYKKTSGLEFEVFVVDNASEDGSVEAIKEAFPQIRVIANENNVGFGSANNIAIKESNAKYVFLLNTDTILINNAVKILFDLMESDEKIGACGGNLFNKMMEPVHSYGFFNTPKRSILRLLGLRYFIENFKNDLRRDELQEVEQLIGADLMLRRSVLDEVGAFDERFFLYFEESELQFRIQKAGYKKYYTPEAQIFHLEGASTSQRRRFRRQIITESEYLYFRLCFPDTPKLLLRFLCTIAQGYRFFTAPTYTFSALKYIWSH